MKDIISSDRVKFKDHALKRLKFRELIRYRLNAIEELLRFEVTRAGIVFIAWLKGHKFRCRALEGKSNYNICVNADLSVSCNCYDTRGYGRLGHLEEDHLLDILNGDRANKIKQKLSEGKLALPNCAYCSELERIPKSMNVSCDGYVGKLDGIMLEAIGACNLTCIGCTRPERPLRSAKMGLANLEMIVKQLASLEIKDIFFFSLGEPFLSKSIHHEIAILRRDLPDSRIVISTNGVYLDSSEKRAAALSADKIVISLFGDCTETAEIYQVGTNYNKVLENLRDLTAEAASSEQRPLIIWKYVVFHWNDRSHQISKAIQDAKSVGVDQIRFVFTTRPLFGISWRFFVARSFRSMNKISNYERSVIFD